MPNYKAKIQRVGTPEAQIQKKAKGLRLHIEAVEQAPRATITTTQKLKAIWTKVATFGAALKRLPVLYRFLHATDSQTSEHEATAETAPAQTTGLSVSYTVESKAKTETGPAEPVKVRLGLQIPVIARLVAYVRAAMFYDKNITTVLTAEAEAAEAETAGIHQSPGAEHRAEGEAAGSVTPESCSSAVDIRLTAAGESAPTEISTVDSAVLDEPIAKLSPAISSGLDGLSGAGATSRLSLTFAWGVTFKNDTGKDLYSCIIRNGDDCPDPVETGAITAPTRPSDAQYHYPEHIGWSRVPYGELDETALENITAGLALYPVFSEELRYYTISFYDDDQTTLLHSMQVQYGDTPEYTPTVAGKVFDSWYPAVEPVTGDATYYASWKEVPTFASASWETIAAISESGEASQYFAIGDTKDVTLSSGTVVTFEIIAFGHDDLADGSGKAGITLLTKYTYGITNIHTAKATNIHWSGCNARKILNSGAFYTRLPADFQSVVKSVKKITTKQGSRTSTQETTYDKFWLLSATEAGRTKYVGWYDCGLNNGTRYSIFSATSTDTFDSKLKRTTREGTAKTYFLRQPYSNGAYSWCVVRSDGTFSYIDMWRVSPAAEVLIGCCI